MATLFNVRSLKASEGSHIPVLIKVLENSTGPVLELGTGMNSTPVLHWLCNANKRRLDSYDSIKDYHRHAWNYRADFHGIHKIENDNWDSIDIEGNHWGVAFVDHAPGRRRNVEMGRLAQHADFVIVHDTEPKSDWHYNYSNQFDKYKYRFDYTKAYPHTSVFSNFKDLSFLNEIL